MTKISNQYSLTNILTADLANSRLGINNVSPTVALDVTGAGKFSGNIVLSGSDSRFNGGDSVGRLILSNSNTTTYIGLYGATHPTLPYVMSFVVNAASALAIASTGAATFSSSVTALKYIANSQATYASLTYEETFKYASSPAGIWFGNSFNSNNNVGLQLRVSNDGTSVQALTITPTGNVGIGLTSILAKLHIENTSSADPTSLSSVPTTNIFGMSTSPGGMLAAGIGTTGGTHIWLQGRNVGGAGVSYPIVLQPLGGNVGIGTSSPGAILHVVGTSQMLHKYTGSTDNFAFGQFNTSGDASINNLVSANLLFATANTERMRITSGGVVLIGATSTGNSERFNVTQSGVNWATAINHTNSTQFFMDLRYNGTQIGAITGNGTTTTYAATSDYRLKEDLKEIKGIEKVSAIKVYDYKWKSDNSRMDGVLAHELQEVLPYAVTGIKDGKDMQGVDYSKIVPVLVKAVQELSAEINLLKNK
jgi:uncharacterized protein YaiE (UPF0345 family)